MTHPYLTSHLQHDVLTLYGHHYLGDETVRLDEGFNVAYNRQGGDSRDGHRIILYYDAGLEYVGWSFMMDRVTGIGTVADGWRRSWAWVPLPDADPRRDLGQVQEIRHRLVEPGEYP